MLSSQVLISVTDSHSIINNQGMRINPEKDISIGDHVWIGTRAVILKGVIIGNNCVIAACSVITKNVDENTCIGGIPGKLLKANINWTRERIANDVNN